MSAINFAQELILASLERPMTTAALRLAWPELRGVNRQLQDLEEAGMVKRVRADQLALFGRSMPQWARCQRARTICQIEQAAFSRFNSQPRKWRERMAL